jgi:hypothetical protein
MKLNFVFAQHSLQTGTCTGDRTKPIGNCTVHLTQATGLHCTHPNYVMDLVPDSQTTELEHNAGISRM